MTLKLTSPDAHPRQHLYGRRKGRPLHKRKAKLVAELLPRLQFAVDDKKPLTLGDLFDTTKSDLWLEIGFGGGEHLAAQAKQNPEIGFIGCEPFINGVASLLDHIDRDQLTNVRIFPNDARFVLDALPDASVARCFVLFADPWPKARHAERRFISNENIPRLARVMRSGAELRLATDDAQLADWMRDHMQKANDFITVYDTYTPPTDWVATRYEAKGIQAGRKPAYMLYRRK